MRLSDFYNDPLATQAETCEYMGVTNCWPMQTTENIIATRGDLMPANGTYALGAFGHRNHVATDSKMSSYSTFDPVCKCDFCIPLRMNDFLKIFCGCCGVGGLGGAGRERPAI